MNKPIDTTLDLPIPFTTTIDRSNVRAVVASCERSRAVTPVFVQLQATPCTCGHELGDHGSVEPHPCGCERVGEACPCMHFEPETPEQAAAGDTRPGLVLIERGAR